MAASNFENALALVLGHEGGLSEDKHDPGGRTYQGILQTEYDVYRRSKGERTRDVAKMEPAERDEIYKKSYWDMVRADDLPVGLDYVLFDGAVNSGVSRSIQWLQRALGSVSIDGSLGPVTLAAVGQYTDMDTLIQRSCEARREFLRHLSILPYFPGLLIRVNDVQKTALAWASGVLPAAKGLAAEPSAKAYQKTAVTAPSPATGNVMAAAGAGALAVGAAAQGHLIAVAPSAPTTVAPTTAPTTPAPTTAAPTTAAPSTAAPAAPSAVPTPTPSPAAPVTAKPAVPPPVAPAAKPGVAVQPPQPWLTITQNQSIVLFAGIAVLLILGLYLSVRARQARARRADALGLNSVAKTALDITSTLAKGGKITDVPLVKSLTSRILSWGWIAVTIVINVIVLAKLLQHFGLAHETWHQPFYYLGTLYDTYAAQAFNAVATSVNQQFGVTVPVWTMPAVILYISMASAFVVASTGLMKRANTAEDIWGAVVHAGWIVALPAFVLDAVRYHVVARFAKQNTLLFFAYIGAFVGIYIAARFINDDILPMFTPQLGAVTSLLPPVPPK